MRKTEAIAGAAQELRLAWKLRTQRNPRYSLRAFARDLGVSPSTLSELLNGRHALSRASARRVARGLGYDEKTAEEFAARYSRGRGPSRSSGAGTKARRAGGSTGRDKGVLHGSLDQFRCIADWWHLPVLELIGGAKLGAPAIAARLGLDLEQAEDSLARLSRLKLARKSGDAWVALRKRTSWEWSVPSQAAREFHRQILAKAEEALEAQPMDRRAYTTTIESFDPALLPELRARILEFRDEIVAFIRSRRGRSRRGRVSKRRVHALSLQLFDLEAAR